MNGLQTVTKVAYEETLEKVAFLPAIMGAVSAAPILAAAARAYLPAITKASATYGPHILQSIKGVGSKASLAALPAFPYASRFVRGQAAAENAPYLATGTGILGKVRDVYENTRDSVVKKFIKPIERKVDATVGEKIRKYQDTKYGKAQLANMQNYGSDDSYIP